MWEGLVKLTEKYSLASNYFIILWGQILALETLTAKF